MNLLWINSNEVWNRCTDEIMWSEVNMSMYVDCECIYG